MTYSEKLKSPKWQKKRLEILSRDEFTCQNCYDTERTLHVHHKFYIKGHEPWEYPNHVFKTLCEVCHANEEGLKDEAKEALYRSLLTIGLMNGDIIQISEYVAHLPYIDFYPPHNDFVKFLVYSNEAKTVLIEAYNQYLLSKQVSDPLEF